MRWWLLQYGHCEWVRSNSCLVYATHLSSLCLAENETAGSKLLHRNQTDRPRCQQDLQEPHHVHGPLWSQVSTWFILAQCCAAYFAVALHLTCSGFSLLSLLLGVTSGLEAAPNTHMHTHTHTCTQNQKGGFLLSVTLAFLSVHKAPQEMAFTQKCAQTSSVHLKPIANVWLHEQMWINVSLKRWILVTWVIWESCQLKSLWLSPFFLLFVSHFLLNSKPLSPNRPKHRFILLGCPLFPCKSTAVPLKQKHWHLFKVSFLSVWQAIRQCIYYKRPKRETSSLGHILLLKCLIHCHTHSLSQDVSLMHACTHSLTHSV